MKPKNTPYGKHHQANETEPIKKKRKSTTQQSNTTSNITIGIKPEK